MAMPQCSYLAKGAKRPSHTTNTIKFDRIPFDPCNSIEGFDLCPFDQKNSTYLQPPIINQKKASRNQLELPTSYRWNSRTNQVIYMGGQGQFVTSHLGDNMASVTWATKVSTKWVDQLTDIFKEVSIFVVRLGRFAPFAK